MASDPAFYALALRRIGWMILVLGVLGAAAMTTLRGPLVGWQHVVAALAPGAKRQKSWRFIFRIVLLGALACAIIKFLGLNVAAAVTGLLVSAAAVILEIVFELIYARA
jgi:hypothetical protein